SQVTDQIKDRVAIVDVVREYVPELKKAGVNWKARCPFHQEKTPSFTVHPGKGFWHCFGCSKGGDVFAFIQEAEGIEFPDALRLLANRAGVKLEKQDPQKESKRSRMLDILRLGARWYHEALLKAKSGEVARHYLVSRGITSQTSDTWLLGFTPDAWEGVSNFLKSRGYRDDEIAEAGLSSTNDRGNQYDRFRNRVMFPITDVHGSVVGFTARKLSEEDLGAKYINTPETAVYKKSSILYGLAVAKQSIRKQDLAVIVEGNMDVISSHQAGITHVVASSGTALTAEQILLIKRYTQNIALSFDPDAAGQTAASRGLEIAWQHDMNLSVVRLPEKIDPDNLIKKDPKLWEQAIADRIPFLDWVLERASSQNDVVTAAGKKQAARFVLSWITRISDPIEQAHYLQKLSQLIHVDESILRSVLNKHRSVRHPAAESKKSPPPAPRKQDILALSSVRLIGLVVFERGKREFDPLILTSDTLRELYKRRKELYDGHIDLFDAELQSLAREVLIISEEYRALSEDQRNHECMSLVNRLTHGKTSQKLLEIRNQIHQAEAAGDIQTLERHIAEWQILNQELHHPTHADKKEDNQA
ncbi:DNA primase, partial [bacterium CG10_46_32]